MIKLDDKKHEIVPMSKCNLKGLPGIVAITRMNPAYCPICGNPLLKNFSYGVQINQDECEKFPGSVCWPCDTFFTYYEQNFCHLEKNRVDKAAYRLMRDYNVTYDHVKYKSLFRKKSSAFRQYILLRTKEFRVITVVSNPIEQNADQDVWHCSSSIAIFLLREERNRFIIIDGKKYCIEKIRTREILDSNVQLDIALPDFTTETTVYIYCGNIDCHTKHHIVEYKATIPSLDGEASFFVEYCVECGEFLMKYSDYEVYIRRLKMFPLKVRMNDNSFENRNNMLSEKSPLKLNGYSVEQNRGLNSSQRHAILTFIVDYGILSKRKVLDYLEMFIKMSEKCTGKEAAVNKWREDKAFLLDYHEHEVPHINIGRIERRKRPGATVCEDAINKNVRRR